MSKLQDEEPSRPLQLSFGADGGADSYFEDFSSGLRQLVESHKRAEAAKPVGGAVTTGDTQPLKNVWRAAETMFVTWGDDSETESPEEDSEPPLGELDVVEGGDDPFVMLEAESDEEDKSSVEAESILDCVVKSEPGDSQDSAMEDITCAIEEDSSFLEKSSQKEIKEPNILEAVIEERSGKENVGTEADDPSLA